ncbi:unnamed protein product [Macrosiphum euphorbiae]|uniref:Uncharacterized protein n=1 Tax=Macrosiphum euphorbiae TaxID=13131 RepID=A0AAV0WMA4_9HEMI|nr:unnamed protein product [Macrosiphum euphorbiae]
MSAPPSLLKTAYYACSNIERNKFDLLEVPDVDMQNCCRALFEIIKINKKLNGDNNTNRQTLYSSLNLRYEEKYKTNLNDKFKNICSEAVTHNHMDCLKLAHEIGIGWGDGQACTIAAETGNLEFLRYAKENGCPWDARTCTLAAKSGHLECLKYARENGCDWDVWTCAFASDSGQLECLMYARENGCPWDGMSYILAKSNGHSACMKYVLKDGLPGIWRG